MIGDLIFFIKITVYTLVLVVFMQVKIGKTTLEQKTIHFIRQSNVMEPIRHTAEGGVVAIQQLWSKISQSLGSKISNTMDSSQVPGQRSLGIQLRRSQAFIKEQAEKAKQQIAEQAAKQDFSEIKNEVKKQVKNGLFETANSDDIFEQDDLELQKEIANESGQ